MYFDPEQLRQVISDRQLELQAEAAARRLVPSTPMRVRIARRLRCAAARLERAAAARGRRIDPLPDCG